MIITISKKVSNKMEESILKEFLLGNEAFEKKEYDNAIKHYKECLREKESIDALSNIGMCYLKKFNIDRKRVYVKSAIEIFIYIMKVDDTNFSALMGLVNAYIKIKDYKKAYICTNRAIALNEEDEKIQKQLNKLESKIIKGILD